MKSSHILSLIVLAITGFVFTACESYIEPQYRLFKIPAGEHYSTYSVEALQSSTLAFQVLFDSSAIYTTKDPIQQFSTNKLLGFADCNSQHHENSARFGWQWVENELQILAYNYVNGERQEAFIGVAEIGKPAKCSIAITKTSYIFTMDNYPPVAMERGTTCDMGLYYMLFPYFGGQETAPHDITIRIQMMY